MTPSDSVGPKIGGQVQTANFACGVVSQISFLVSSFVKIG